MTLLLTQAQEQRLQELAKHTLRTEQELANEAIDRFLDYEQDFISSVEEGVAAGNGGELHSHQDVKEYIALSLAS